MTESRFVHDGLCDDELIAEVRRLAGCERHATARLISALAELDARRLYLGQGCSSMFTYCTQVLHLAEHAAYNRIEAARAARRFPVVLTHLADGSVHLSAVRLLAPHLTRENHAAVLREASHKSKREVEQIVARLQPQPDVVASIRKLPPVRTMSAPAQPQMPESPPSANAVPAVAVPPPRGPEVSALAPERYKVQFTVGRETYEKLRRAQDLLRHRVPNGDPAVIFERAITLLLADLEKKKIASTERPRHSVTAGRHSRHVPAEVRRLVWARDGGRCRFEGPHGRCRETGLLEFHHVVPYAAGGAATAENVELRCGAHNRHEAEQYFGQGFPMFLREERGSGIRSDGPTRPGPAGSS
jgi:5-methylcytosine-specific restriction endonuclease McrA